MNVIKLRKGVHTWKRVYTESMNSICGAITLVLVCINIYKVFTRYIIPIPTNWTDDISTLAMTWQYAFGIAAAWLVGQHLMLEVTDKLYPQILKDILWWLMQVLGIVGGIRIIPMANYTMSLYTGMKLTLLGYSESLRYFPILLSGILLVLAAVTNIAERLIDYLAEKRGLVPPEEGERA